MLSPEDRPAAEHLLQRLEIHWILNEVPGARKAAENGDLLFGNIDTYVIWNLTGGIKGGVHVTDATNASRTQLMNLESLDWDEEILRDFDIPRVILPRIASSAEIYGYAALDAVAEFNCRWPRRSTGGPLRPGML